MIAQFARLDNLGDFGYNQTLSHGGRANKGDEL